MHQINLCQCLHKMKCKERGKDNGGKVMTFKKENFDGIYKPGAGSRGGTVGHGHHAGVGWHLQTGPVVMAREHGQTG